MTQPPDKITPDVWDQQADLYELGLKHAREIARDLGVSPQTVTREMKKRGAMKGSRVSQTVADLEAFLERRAKRAVLLEMTDSERRRKKQELGERAVARMMSALMAADLAGDLNLASNIIDETAEAFGLKRSRR